MLGVMTVIDQLLRVVEAFCAGAGIAEGTLAGRVLRDGKGFRVLREGGDLTTRKAERAFRYLSDHWPEGAVWPPEVPRPSISTEAGAIPGPVPPAGPQAAAAASRAVHTPARDGLPSRPDSSPLSARDAAGHSAGDLSRPPAAFSSGRHPPALDAAE